MALQDAIAAVQTLAGAVVGIRAAPEYLPEAINVFPILVCYASTGSYEYSPAGVMKGLHNIILELHVDLYGLERDMERVMPYAESIPLALMADPTLTGSASTFERITYIFGGMTYGKKDTMGFRFTIEKVKLLTTI